MYSVAGNSAVVSHLLQVSLLVHTVQEVPTAPPPVTSGNEGIEVDNEDEEMGPRLRVVIPQSQPSRPESMLMNINGSLSIFESHQEERVGEGDIEDMGVASLPPPPPSPPASDEGEEVPTLPTTAPPPVPDHLNLPLTEDDLHGEQPATPTSGVPDDLIPPSDGEDGRQGETGMFAPPTSSPPPTPDGSPMFVSTESLPALPTSRPPLISDDTADHNDLPLLTSKSALISDDTIDSSDIPPPTLPNSRPPLISDDSSFSSMEQPPQPTTPLTSGHVVDVPLTDSGSRCPPGYVQLEIELKKRAGSELGVTVASSGPPMRDHFMIRRIKVAGAAAKDGRLRPGDRLIAVNGKSLAGLNHAAVLQELNNAPKDCHLTIWRDTSSEAAATTNTNVNIPTFSGSRSSLTNASDDEEEGFLTRKRSLSNISLENSPLAVAKKRSASRGISPRDSPLAHNRLNVASARVKGSPLSKRWSAEDVPLVGPAGELLGLSPPPFSVSSNKQSPERSVHEPNQNTMEFVHDYVTDIPLPNMLPQPPGTPPTDTPPEPPGTPPTDTPPGTPLMDTPPQPPGTPPTDIPPQPPGTPPTDTPPQRPSTPPTDTSPSTPPPPFPSAPPPTLQRGMKLDMTAIAAAMRIAADEISDDSADEEAPPPPPQTMAPPTNELPSERVAKEAPPPVPQSTPPSARDGSIAMIPDKEAPLPVSQTTPPIKIVETDGMENEINRKAKEVERPKSLGPVPKGNRLEGTPFEIEVVKGLLGGLGLTVCENELGMIAVKALTTRSPITKDGNIR